MSLKCSLLQEAFIIKVKGKVEREQKCEEVVVSPPRFGKTTLVSIYEYISSKFDVRSAHVADRRTILY